MLERVPNPHPRKLYLARFTAPEFTSLCPITGQPDFAHLVIDYAPARWLVESKSLKLYLTSFRNHGAFHEDCTLAIAGRLVEFLAPRWLRIARLLVSARRHADRRVLADGPAAGRAVDSGHRAWRRIAAAAEPAIGDEARDIAGWRDAMASLGLALSASPVACGRETCTPATGCRRRSAQPATEPSAASSRPSVGGPARRGTDGAVRPHLGLCRDRVARASRPRRRWPITRSSRAFASSAAWPACRPLSSRPMGRAGR